MEEAVKKHMGLKVKIMRERAKLTQEQLAEECGVSWRTIPIWNAAWWFPI